MKNNLVMKKTSILLLCFSMIVLSFSSCDKESDSKSTIFSSVFDNVSDLDLWTQSADGEAVIEQGYLKLRAISGCFIFETVDVIPVKQGKTYTLRFKGKVDPTLLGETGHCAGDYMVDIVQGNDFLVFEGFGKHLDWTQKSFAFKAASSAGVRIRFLIGTEKGAWLDHLELTED